MPAHALSLRPSNPQRCDPQWRLPALDARSHRLRRHVSEAHGGAVAAAGRGVSLTVNRLASLVARRSVSVEELVPQGFLPELCDQGVMRQDLDLGEPARQLHRTLPHKARGRYHGTVAYADGRQRKCRLASANQLEIDIGQQLGIEQSAVLVALRIVDAVALA